MDIRKLQRTIVDGLEDVKAQDIVVFNTEHLSPLFERVIVASGTGSASTIAAICAEHVAVLGRSWYDPGAPCAVASVDTLIRAKGLESWAAQVTLWVTDEGHHVVDGKVAAGKILDRDAYRRIGLGAGVVVLNQHRAGAAGRRHHLQRGAGAAGAAERALGAAGDGDVVGAERGAHVAVEGEGEGDADGDGDGVGVGEGEGEGDADGEGVGVGVGVVPSHAS